MPGNPICCLAFRVSSSTPLRKQSFPRGRWAGVGPAQGSPQHGVYTRLPGAVSASWRVRGLERGERPRVVPAGPAAELALRREERAGLARGIVPSPWHRPQPVASSPARGIVPSPGRLSPAPCTRGRGWLHAGELRVGRLQGVLLGKRRASLEREGAGRGSGKPVVGVWLAEQELLRRPWVGWQSLAGSGPVLAEGCKSWEGFGPSRRLAVGRCVSRSTVTPHSPLPSLASPASGRVPSSPSSSSRAGARWPRALGDRSSVCSVSKTPTLAVKKTSLGPRSPQHFCCFSVLRGPAKLQSFHRTDTGVLSHGRV